MIRHVMGAIVVALFSSALPVGAQPTVFKVSADAANVHKSPSTGSPVIGKAPRGASLEVTRELGSWVKVVWAKAKDGVGYVHVSTGSIAHAATPAQTRVASAPAATTAEKPIVIPPPPPPPSRRGSTARDMSPPPRGYMRTPAHLLGFGGRVGGPQFSVGAAARAWSQQRYGVQVELSRVAPGNDPGRTTSIQFAPSVIYALHDRVFDYWWLRPYVGAGPSLERRHADGLVPGASDPLAETSIGFQVFGGGEFTFASLPRFALSGDLGYRRQPTSFAGVDPGGLGLVVSGHWYWK